MDESIGKAIDQFLDDTYNDVLQTSNIQTDFSISGTNQNITGKLTVPLGCIVPDGTN